MNARPTFNKLTSFRLMAVGCPCYYRQKTTSIKITFSVILVSLTLSILGLNLDYFGIFGLEVLWIGVLQWLISRRHAVVVSILNIYFPCIGLTIAVVTSAASVVCLVRSEDRVAHTRGSVTIILMNLGLILYLVLLIIATFYLPFKHDDMLKYMRFGRYEFYYIYYFVGTYMPMLLAVYNPMVVAMRCHGTRGLARKWFIRFLALCSIPVRGSFVNRRTTEFSGSRSRS